MFVRKTALPSVRDRDKSGGRNVQLGDRRGESSNFSQRGNLLQIHHGGDTLPRSSHGGNHLPSHQGGNSPPRSSRGGNTLLRGSHGRNPLPSPRGGNTFPRSSRGGKSLPRSSREGNTRRRNSDWENTLPRNSRRGKLLPSHRGGNSPPRSSYGGNPLPRSSHDGSPRGGNSFPRGSRGRNLPSSTRKGNSLPRSSHGDDSFPRSSHRDDSFPRNSHGDDSFPRSSHGDDSLQRSSNRDDSFPRSSHGDDSFPRSSHGDDSYPRSSYGGNSFPRSSHGDDSFPRSSHEGNPPSSTRGGNAFPLPHERNRYGGPEGGRENDSRDGEFYQGYQKAEEGPKTYMDFEGRNEGYNQDRGSNFSSRWEERNAGASVNQRDYNTSMDPSRGSSPSYMNSVRGSNSRLLDPNRRSTMSFRGMQSQRKMSEPYRSRERQKDKRGRKRSEPYMNQERETDKRGMRGDFEETALGILDKVLPRNLQESTTQNYPSYSDELDVDRYERWNQSYEQDDLGMGAQESPSHFKVPGQRNNRGKSRRSIEERMQEFATSYEVSDLRDIDSDPQPFEVVSMNSGMYPPEGSGFINDMELDLYDSSHQEHFKKAKPNSRKRQRQREIVEALDNKKPKTSIMSRLGPKLGVSRNPSGEDSAGNNIRMRDDGALYTVKGIEEKSDKRLDNLTPPSNKLDELNRLAQNFRDFPSQALYCKECDIDTFATVFKFFKHGITEEHLSSKKSYSEVSNATFISLARHAQLAYAQNIGPWNPNTSSMCKMCRVPDKLRSGSDHSNVQECWVLHQYAIGGCCTFANFKGRSGIEIHRSSLGHLQNEYLRNKERENFDKKERERLRAVKDIFTTESNKDEVGRNFSIKFIKKHRSELEVIQGFGKNEVPEEITSLIKTHRVSDTDSMKRVIHNPKKFPFQPYRPSVPHFTSQVLFVTDLECIICGTTMGKSKQSVIDHCSTKEHYDNVVKKHERVKKVISLSKEEEEKKVTATGMRKNRRESEKNVNDRKETVREAAGKSKWERGGEDEEDEDDNEWGIMLSEYDDGDDAEVDYCDDAEVDYCDDDADDVRMDNLEDKVEEAVNESNDLEGKKGGGDKRKKKVPITFNLKEYEANKAGTQPSGKKTNVKEEDLTTRKEGEKEKQEEKPARPLQKKKFYF